MTWDIATAKRRLGIPTDNTDKDDDIKSAMDGALAAAESYCDRRFLKQDDVQEFTPPYAATLLVRRYPLVSLTSLAPLDPQPDPAPDPIAIPQQWRMDKKHGMVFVVGMAPYIDMLAPVGSTPPPANVFMVGGRPGFILSFVGGYDPLPADLEMALWMVFDSVWGATPGWGADAGTQGGGVVKGFGIDGMRLDYDNTTGSGSVGSGKVDAWGVLPANAVGILDSYRAESAALGG